MQTLTDFKIESLQNDLSSMENVTARIQPKSLEVVVDVPKFIELNKGGKK